MIANVKKLWNARMIWRVIATPQKMAVFKTAIILYTKAVGKNANRRFSKKEIFNICFEAKISTLE